ncbi:MAG TPA: c-type cytochrome [Chloroflexota bacterium]|nr:c-type cytochrome [Chloroflexota bacterium]
MPQLLGKLDANPYQVNTTWLQADTAGVYRGECAEFCGLQHAHMGFLVVADERADFDAWLEHQRQPAEIAPSDTPTAESAATSAPANNNMPGNDVAATNVAANGVAANGVAGIDVAANDVAAGAQAFARAGCIQCHAIRYGDGPVGGRLGPDLTHVGSRRTLAGNTLNNTLGAMEGWIGNPQAIKPGNNMPALPLDAATLRALAEYLEALK